MGTLAGVLLMLVLNYTIGFGTKPASSNAPKNLTSSQASSDAAFQEAMVKAADIIDLLDMYYVDTIARDDLYEMMYSGLVYGVGDPYTAYLDAENFDRYMIDTEGEYVGIGIVVAADVERNRIVIVSPYEGHAGAKAGLLPGDEIIRVNGVDVFGDTLDYAVSVMRGEPNTNVNITVYRSSDNRTFDLDITRERIQIPTVSHKMLDDQIGYLRITAFERVTLAQFKEALADLQAQNMQGFILDLRNNPGGLVDVVCDITDMLVPSGTIVSTLDKYNEGETITSDAKCIDMPLVVLVNGASASASEILSGAVQDLNAGKLVGTQTYGKGLIQSLFPFDDGSALKITIAKYFTPNGICIQDEGIAVDYEIEMSDELSMQISSLTLDEDVQLQKAIEVVKEWQNTANE